MCEQGAYYPDAFFGISFPVETAEAIEEAMEEEGIYLPDNVYLFYVETWHSGNSAADGYEDVVNRCVGFLGIVLGDLKPTNERKNLLGFLRKHNRFLSDFGIGNITPKVVAGQFHDLDELLVSTRTWPISI